MWLNINPELVEMKLLQSKPLISACGSSYRLRTKPEPAQIPIYRELRLLFCLSQCTVTLVDQALSVSWLVIFTRQQFDLIIAQAKWTRAMSRLLDVSSKTTTN